MARLSGTYVTTTTLSETVRAFVPHPLPPAAPPLSPLSYETQNRAAEVALARLRRFPGSCRPSNDYSTAQSERKRC